MKARQNFANVSALQFAIREMRSTFSKLGYWLVLGAIASITAISGPFNTISEFSLLQRFAYWGAIVVLTAIAAQFTGIFVSYFLRSKSLNKYLEIFGTGLAASIPVTLIVWVISGLVAGNTESGVSGLIELLPQTVPICFVIVLAYYFLGRARAQNEQPTSEPAFFKRLPVELGKQIYSLQAQDHYVQVTTSRGSELILIRLEDAIGEIEGVEGFRTHRSWWVAKDAVQKLHRTNGKVQLVLKNQDTIPVSRSHQSNVKEELQHL